MGTNTKTVNNLEPITIYSRPFTQKLPLLSPCSLTGLIRNPKFQIKLHLLRYYRNGTGTYNCSYKDLMRNPEFQMTLHLLRHGTVPYLLYPCSYKGLMRNPKFQMTLHLLGYYRNGTYNCNHVLIRVEYETRSFRWNSTYKDTTVTVLTTVPMFLLYKGLIRNPKFQMKLHFQRYYRNGTHNCTHLLIRV